MTEYTIRQTAKLFRVTHRALRFWESKGLLAPRRDHFQRLYSDADGARIAEIKAFSAAGFELKEMRQIFAMGQEDRQRYVDARLSELASKNYDQKTAILALMERKK